MRHRPTNTNAKGEITFGYSGNQDKSKITQSVQVNVNSNDKNKPSEFNERSIETPPSVNINTDDDEIKVVYPTTTTTSKDSLDIKQNLINKELMHIYRDMLISNSGLILSLIDASGKIILSQDSLIHVISTLCKVSEDKVKIQYFLDEDITCCGSLSKNANPIKEISTIKVTKNGIINDLSLTYNDIYNLIVDEYKISLEKFYLC